MYQSLQTYWLAENNGKTINRLDVLEFTVQVQVQN